MGNCFSISLSCDQVMSQGCNYLCSGTAYIHNLEENLKNLNIAVQKLKEKRDDLLRRVDMEENRGLQRLSEVQGWLSRVEAIETHVHGLLDARTVETQRLCLCGYASKSCVSSYQYGKEVFEGLKEVETLKSDENFEAVARRAPISWVDERPTRPTIGMETKLEEVWNLLMEDEVGILGLYGMGGVGKTTLLTQLHNKFCGPANTFDLVIWVVVSKDFEIGRIQEEIGKKLCIFDEGWQQKGLQDKTSDIYRVLSHKKFMLLLDDIWKKVDLTDIGVPIPNKDNGCKIALTARSKDVCGLMGVDVETEMKCLTTDVALDLFKKKVGDKTLKSHRDIPRLAEIVAQKCRGLPLALNVIGGTMASKTKIQEWHNAIDDLTFSATNFSGMEDEILPILKYSYDDLKEKVKLCFLYCALFPEDYPIDKEILIDFWVGEGFIEKNTERDRVENEGFEMVGTLVRACLLEEDDGGSFVKMHDVNREMALWIASYLKRGEENFVVKTRAWLHHMPEVKNWESVSRMSLMRNEIANICSVPECPKLQTLFLHHNELANISSEFFQSIPNLVVLDLSFNNNLEELPETISLLVSLRYLNLSYTRIRKLPIGWKDFRELVYLNLEWTRMLQNVDGISSLSNLQILRLRESGIRWSLSLVEELQLLEFLNYLSISLGDVLILEQILSSYKLTHCIKDLVLEKITSTSDGISLVVDLDRLGRVEIADCDISEIKIDWESKGSGMVAPLLDHKSLSNSCFKNLFTVSIMGCRRVRDLTWLLFAPNIVFLVIHDLPDLKEIIRKEKVANDTYEQPFGKVEDFDLSHLPEMESIYWDPLPFFCLKRFKIRRCPKLRKLPLNSKSAERCNFIMEISLMEQVEWEDEEIKKRVKDSLIVWQYV